MINEKVMKRIVQEVLSEMNRQGCNVPMITSNVTLGGDGNFLTPAVQNWVVIFTCENPNDINNRKKVSFEVDVQPNKSENEVKVEVRSQLHARLGKI